MACAAGLAAVACGIGIGRDYSAIPPGQVGFEDLCGLQDYFDTIDTMQAAEPALVSAVDIEGQATTKTVRGGKNRYAFETDFQLKHLRRVLSQNWTRLPDDLATAKRIDLEVHWSEKSGVKRVVTDTDAELIVGRQSFPLPYHVCLSELLYGDPLYRQRREVLGLPTPTRPLLGDAGIGNAPAAGGGQPTPDAGSAPNAAVAAPPAPAAAGQPVFKPAPPAR